MRIVRFPLLLLVLLTFATWSPAWAGGDRKHVKVSVYDEGRAYCPPRALVIGRVAIPAGRCYRLAVLRDHRGAFLAFVDPSVRIPRGRLERLDDEEGGRIREHIFFLVPLQMTSQLVIVPVNTIQLVRLREEDDEDEDEDHVERINGGRLVVFLPTAPTPSVTIVVTF